MHGLFVSLQTAGMRGAKLTVIAGVGHPFVNGHNVLFEFRWIPRLMTTDLTLVFVDNSLHSDQSISIRNSNKEGYCWPKNAGKRIN